MPKTMPRIPMSVVDFTKLDTVFRTYEVTLVADTPKGPVELEPTKVVLRYVLEDANELHPLSEQAKAEVLRRAVRLERKEHTTSEDTRFYLGDLKLKRHTLRRKKVR